MSEAASSEAARAAIAAYRAWQDAFNERDVEGMLARMHFPHVRLAGAGFHTWESGEDFAEGQQRMTARLAEEGWARTDNLSVEVVHASEDKVHLSLRNARVRADGSAYHTFQALWIFTLIDGRWGVQFRSSYLEGVVHAIGAASLG